MLFGGAETTKQRQNLGVWQVATQDRLLGIPNLVLTAEEYQHIPGGFPGQLIEGGSYAIERVEVSRGFVVGFSFG